MYLELTHYFETTQERRTRLKSSTVHGQALCSNGSAHQRTTRDWSKVECPSCLKLKTKEKSA